MPGTGQLSGSGGLALWSGAPGQSGRGAPGEGAAAGEAPHGAEARDEAWAKCWGICWVLPLFLLRACVFLLIWNAFYILEILIFFSSNVFSQFVVCF